MGTIDLDDDRTPVSSDLQSYFDFTEIDHLSAANGLMEDLRTLARNAANAGIGIFCCNAPSKDALAEGYKMLDIAKMPLEDSTLGGILADLIPGRMYRDNVLRYFLISSACYLETPTSRFMGGKTVSSFNKSLVTSNEEVATSWSPSLTGPSLTTRFGGNLSTEALEDGTISIVRLETDKDGYPRIARPRADVDLSAPGTRLMPYEVLDAYLQTILERAKDTFVRVTYLKDSGQIRSLVTTLNRDLLSEIYSPGRVNGCLSASEDTAQPNVKKRARGYVTVPEVGLPETDQGCRALNFNRILAVEYDVEPDLRFVDVNLEITEPSFRMAVEEMDNDRVRKLVLSLIQEGVVQSSEWIKNDGSWKREPTWDSVSSWVAGVASVLGTEFKKSLHLYMVNHSDFFEGYTGGISAGNAAEPQDNFSMGFDMDDLLGND